MPQLRRRIPTTPKKQKNVVKEQFLRIYRPLRDFLFSIVNREFLIFLFFLALSTVFWLLTTLNDTSEQEYKIPITLTNVPRDVVITSDMDDTLRVTIRDKGFTLAAYLSGRPLKPVALDFQNYCKQDNGRGHVALADLQRAILPNLYGSSKIVSIKPERIDFYYNHGQWEKVPVRLVGDITPAKSYYLTRTRFSPSNVVVYADKNILDTLKSVYTEPVTVTNFSDTVVKTVKLQRIKGAKIVPAQVRITLCTDVLTEESVEVPIHAENMPAGKTLRTFPPRVKVRFVTGASVYRQIKPGQFRVEADFNDLSTNNPEKCTLHLRKVPANVRDARLELSEVDYLIEQ